MSTNRIHHLIAVGSVVAVGVLLVLAVQVGLTAAATGTSDAGSSSGIPGVTTKTVTVTVGSRSLPARLSYPTQGGPYPALAFGHGYLARASSYASTLDALARAGIVVIAPDSETGSTPSHGGFADDLNRSLAWLASESRAGGAVVPRGKVDGSRTAVAGHSIGGGAALLAAARSHTVDAVATLAPVETSPSAAAAARRLRIASLFVVGTNDPMDHLTEDTATMFWGAPSPSLLALIPGGSRCGFMDRQLVPGCDARGRISYARQRALTHEQLRRWLERYLKGTPGAKVTGVQGISYTQHSGASPSRALQGAVSIHVQGKRVGPFRGEGRFTISGAITDRGRFVDRGGQGPMKIVRHLYGARGTIRIDVIARHGPAEWTITAGTKAYAGLHGWGTGGRDSSSSFDITMEGTISK